MNNREHILNIAFSFDDEAIRKRIEETGYNDIIKLLVEDAKNTVGTRYYSGRPVDIPWASIVDKAAGRFLVENKDEIIDIVASKLYDSIRRSKSFKDKVSGVIDGR